MEEKPLAQHTAARSPMRVALPVGLAVTAFGMLLSMMTAQAAPQESAKLPQPATVKSVPSVQSGATSVGDPCSNAAVKQAIAQGDDAATVTGFGGGEMFREAVVAGNAPCISLSDPARIWAIVNKAHPLVPLDYAPPGLTPMPLQMTTGSNRLRSDVDVAVGKLADAANAAGVGRIGANNGYRSYPVQVATHTSIVRSSGQAKADAGSARPGFSEHQTGLALDLVACSRGCGGLDDFGATPQGKWVAEHAWEYGFIVRYEASTTPITGYEGEPWHVRYIGVDLATAYHAGGFHTLEEFFGQPAAPDYAH